MKIKETRDFESIQLAHDRFLTKLHAQCFIAMKPVSYFTYLQSLPTFCDWCGAFQQCFMGILQQFNNKIEPLSASQVLLAAIVANNIMIKTIQISQNIFGYKIGILGRVRIKCWQFSRPATTFKAKLIMIKKSILLLWTLAKIQYPIKNWLSKKGRIQKAVACIFITLIDAQTTHGLF